ncbi:unnamed protein product [Gongylonema pulchrum]|uniref:CBM21 domain-containing protein n=1 Tax=Gongylonema pulchrum TaxID=637853 RepID=A0A183EYD1_9BILA|nr:unnamed protein product [Gongylonema pulchrum]
MDRLATYQPSSSKFYDTFSFDIELPTDGADPNARIEFCICFEANFVEGYAKPQRYWDSNGGRNYVLTSQEASSSEPPRHVPVLFGKQDRNDAYSYDLENWTRFAAWKNLSTDEPYW